MTLHLKSLDYVVLIVDELEPSIRFYADRLGLEIAHRAPDYAQFVTGTTRLGLFTQAAMARTLGTNPPGSGGRFELGFFVDDCDDAHARLTAAGVPSVAAPVTRPWGQRTAYVADPDGNLIELVQDLRSTVDVT